jgi:hypothetical protein
MEIGDRVINPKYGYKGTIVFIKNNIVHIKRDDEAMGSGLDGSWTSRIESLTLLPKRKKKFCTALQEAIEKAVEEIRNGT